MLLQFCLCSNGQDLASVPLSVSPTFLFFNMAFSWKGIVDSQVSTAEPTSFAFHLLLVEIQDETEFPLLELLDQSRWFQMPDERIQSSEVEVETGLKTYK